MNATSRAAAILAGMTLDEKLAVMSGIDNMYTKGVPRLGVRRIRMADASMGLRDEKIDATAFPAFIGLAATWNRERALAYGEAVGEEFRAADIDVVLGPGVNLYRVHECGRNFEYLGEDPVLAATMVVPYIRGVQSRGVAATVKHFVANNTDWHRCVSNSIVDERTLRELYFVPFEAAVKDAGVRCLMTSYNLLGGEYAGENRWLLTDVLLGDWEFDGLVMSDWMGLWNPAPSIASGLHLEMPAAKAFDPAVDPDDDRGGRRFARGHRRARDANPRAHRAARGDTARGPESAPREERGARRRRARGCPRGNRPPQECRWLLPLDASEGSIGVVGPLGDATPTSGGGAAQVRAIDPVSIAGGIFAVAPDRTLLRVEDGLDEERLLADADVAVACVGYTAEREREGCDRPWELPASDVELIKRASRAAKRTVVVVVAGGGVEMTSWVDDVDAILHTWYPGEIGARALAEILFGEVNPSGKLPISLERVHGDRSSVANYLPDGAELYDKPDFVSQDATAYDVTYAEGVFAGYRHLDALEIEPLFAFGFGLSYTSFSYARAFHGGAWGQARGEVPGHERRRARRHGDRAGLRAAAASRSPTRCPGDWSGSRSSACPRARASRMWSTCRSARSRAGMLRNERGSCREAPGRSKSAHRLETYACHIESSWAHGASASRENVL